ncbi:MAG: peptide chain release factor N(5)-glutamine methyltransferase [Tissierellaceae bacterium]|nr:peptide chain release factor N(5)-glutamine methyltransferase [Tissierellaceae bacterium]
MVTIDDLRRKYKDFPRESLLIFSKLLGVDKSHIYAYGDREVSDIISMEFQVQMKKVQEGTPIQYVLGEKEFMGLNFFVNEKVLIPRFDTEVLVEYILEYIKDNLKGKDIKVLDMCAGSGVIGLTIGHYCKDALVCGVDISQGAIEVANINRERLKVLNVHFLEGDLFAPIGESERFDIVVSNPPYIPSKDIEELDRVVRDFEPTNALDGGIDGLDFYRIITKGSKKHLKDNGLLIYEIGYDQGDALELILWEEGFRDISIMKDSQGHPRVAMGFYRV